MSTAQFSINTMTNDNDRYPHFTAEKYDVVVATYFVVVLKLANEVASAVGEKSYSTPSDWLIHINVPCMGKMYPKAVTVSLNITILCNILSFSRSFSRKKGLKIH